MRIHALQTGSVTIKEAQRRGHGAGPLRLLSTLLDRTWTPHLPIYAWVIEHPEGVLVVDAGETARVRARGYLPRWHPYFRFGARFFLGADEEVGPRLATLGLAPADVRWVVLTHLHTDHAGGLHHFPQAEVLVSRTEYGVAQGVPGKLFGYLPHRWPAWLRPRLVDFAPERLGPFPESLPLTRAGDVHLVPTPGHTPGHLSVVVRDEGTSFVFAGDATYTETLLLQQALGGLTLSAPAGRETLDRLLRYARAVPTVLLPAHDPDAVARLARRATVPV